MTSAVEAALGFANVSFWVFALSFAGISLGAAVQRLSGQGYGLISTPIVALGAPEMLPSAVLLLGIVSGFASSALDISHINRKELPWGFSGRTLGAVLAAMVATALPFERVAVLVGLIVLIAVALSLFGLSVRITRLSLFVAGTIAGIMGTLTAIGAPPMAMLYQGEEPRRSRSMQSTFFFFGMFVSIAALAWQGLIGRMHLQFALAMLPAIGVGLLLSAPLEARFSKEMVRPAALTFSFVAALILIGKSAFG